MCDVISGKRPNRVSLQSEIDEDRSTLDGISIDEDMATSKVMPTSELQELFESAAETISSLFKVSIIIRNATSRDRYARAMVAAKEPLCDFFDISHVGHRFPRLHETPWLEKRLGKAITQRREYLKYCREHHDRLASDIKRSGENQYSMQQERPSRILTSEMQQSNKDEKAELGTKPSGTLNLTSASTLAATLLNRTDEKSDEDRLSMTSYATSLGDDSGNYKLRVPSLPEEGARGVPFQCPYCWSIQMLNDERSWKLVNLSC